MECASSTQPLRVLIHRFFMSPDAYVTRRRTRVIKFTSSLETALDATCKPRNRSVSGFRLIS